MHDNAFRLREAVRFYKLVGDATAPARP